MKSRFILILMLLLNSFLSFSQAYYDINFPDNNFLKNCQTCLTHLKNKPKEILYGFRKDEFNNLYFIVTRKEWFDQLIKKSTDGIAVDIVSRDKYNCTSTLSSTKKKYIKGQLLPPVYLKELRQNMIEGINGEAVFKIGTIPKKFWDKEVEFNCLFIKDKNYCYYNIFYDLKMYRWDLLDMGLYLDTLVYNINADSVFKKNQSFGFQDKVIKFEIPFVKNKSSYAVSDIKPLFDTLHLTDFEVKKIVIRAYSSIEGDKERNLQLEQERANSIINSIKTLQNSNINTEVYSSENWVDFYNDLANTKYSYLLELRQEEIKEILKDKNISSDLEVYLKKHRKAVLVLELQKKNLYTNMPIDTLISSFTKSLKEKNLIKAIEIQNSLFEKIKNHEAPATYLSKLEIPKKSEFSLLLNKNSIFKYLMSENEVLQSYQELIDLQDYIPNDAHLKYNICALKFKIWLLGESMVEPEEFKNEINDLKNYGIDQSLINRMLINYEIIMSEYYMVNGDFASKDKCLKFIQSNYMSIQFSDFDYLSLAQYFASYAKYDWAISLLEKKVKNISVDEDLLFYYINLTIMNEDLTARSDYKTMLINAYNHNKTRFCNLFSSPEKGGITFQLLDNENLKKSFCENCK